jgi:molecular chaperone DnaK (HSP70)
LDEETAYSVEELLGMVLAHAKQQAEDFTEQKIKVVSPRMKSLK